jgi:hypothetical protein
MIETWQRRSHGPFLIKLGQFLMSALRHERTKVPRIAIPEAGDGGVLAINLGFESAGML